MARELVSYKSLADIAANITQMPCAIPLTSKNKYEFTPPGFFYGLDYEYDCNEPAVSMHARFDDGYFSKKAIALVGDRHASPRYTTSSSQLFLGISRSEPFMVNQAGLVRKLQSNAGKRINVYNDDMNLSQITSDDSQKQKLFAFHGSLSEFMNEGIVFGFDSDSVAIHIPYGLNNINEQWSEELRSLSNDFSKKFNCDEHGRVGLRTFEHFGGFNWEEGFVNYIKSNILPAFNPKAQTLLNLK